MLALAAIAASATARADPPGQDALPVTVLSVKSDDALDQAEALTTALRKAVRDSKGWSLGEGTQSLEFLALQMKCSEPIDAACEARIAEVIKADRYLWCTIRLDEDFVVGKLNLFVRGKGTNTVPLHYSANLTEATDDALIQVAAEAFRAVAGGPPMGYARIQAGGVDGQLYIDDQPMGAIAAEGRTVQLPAGTHKVLIKAPGYESAEGAVTVRPATTADLNLSLIKKAVEKPVDMRMLGGFLSVGAGVTAGAIGLWAALEVNAIQNEEGFQNYAKGFASDQNVCDQADNNTEVRDVPMAYTPETMKDKCSRAGTMEVVQAITFPLAAVAAGVGGYLLGTSSLTGGNGEEGDAGAEQSRWSIEPAVGPTVQHVQFTYRF